MTTAEELLEHLNKVANRNYRPIKTNLNLIKRLFKLGYTAEDIRKVIELKTMEWRNNEIMAGYIRPSTLFRESNFEEYINFANTLEQSPELKKKFQEKYGSTATKENTARDTLEEIARMFQK